jgi:hypothetical protein
MLYFSCESDNIEQKYLQKPSDTLDIDTTDVPGISASEIAWYPLNGNVNDSLGNNFPLIVVGQPTWVKGLNNDFGKGVHFDGNTYLLVNLGYYDTLSIAFWIKGDEALTDLNNPVLFDYGFDAISAQLDATSGETALLSKKDNSSASSEDASVEYLNSFYRYCFFYFEAGGNYTRVYFKGYTSTGTELVYSENLNFPGIISAESEFLYIGRSSLRDDQKQTYFKGSVDEIHIFTKPLTSAEIESLAFIYTE